MVAMSTMRPPHRGHARTSRSNARPMRFAHVQWRALLLSPHGGAASEAAGADGGGIVPAWKA